MFDGALCYMKTHKIKSPIIFMGPVFKAFCKKNTFICVSSKLFSFYLSVSAWQLFGVLGYITAHINNDLMFSAKPKVHKIKSYYEQEEKLCFLTKAHK